MKKPADPADETRRQAALDALAVLDTASAPVLDELCLLASELCEAPVATITLIDRDRRWHKARVGTDARQGTRVTSFCEHVLRDRATLVVPDLTADQRFRDNPFVMNESGFRAYAGAPLTLSSGEIVGTLCVLDTRVRALSAAQVRGLETLAHAVAHQLEVGAAQRAAEERERLARETLLRQIGESHARRNYFARLWQELREPADQLVGTLDQLAGAGSPVDDAGGLAAARGGARELRDGIVKILELMTVENKRRHSERAEFDLSLALTRAAAPFIARARAKGLKLDVRVEGDDRVLGDAARLDQILNDLIDNAVKFTDRGVVMISRRRDGDDVLVSVSDTGPGLSAEAQRAVLLAPLTADETITRRIRGTGLPIAREIAEVLGGTLSCHSVPGVGATFTLRVPMPSARPDARPVPGLRVLVVDDVTINQKVIRAILAPHRTDVRTAGSGEEALEIFAKETFDLVLMDRYMPGIDGVEATRRMREIEAARGTRTPIFGTSAASESGENEAFLLAGADETVAKPLRIEEFWSKVNRVRTAGKYRVA